MLLPGILGKYLFHSAPAPYHPHDDLIPVNFWGIVVQSILVCIPVHALTLWGLSAYDVSGPVSLFITLLTNVSPDRLAEFSSGAWLRLAAYFAGVSLAVSALAWVAGLAVYKWFKLHQTWTLLRIPNRWYYAFAVGTDVPAQLDVVLEVSGQPTIIYQGIVTDFYTDRTGNLTEVVLRDTKRRDFGKHGEEFKAFHGDRFIVPYRHVKTMNLTLLSHAYRVEEEASDPQKPEAPAQPG